MAQPKPVEGPEKNYVQNIIMEQRTVYRERVQVMKHIRRIRALRIQTRVPRTFQRLIGQGVRNPLPWSLVQTINGMIVKGDPQFTRVPVKPKDREAAARLASTCMPLIEAYGRAIKKDLVYQISDQLAGDGMSICKLRRATVNWPDKSPDELDKTYNDRVEEWLQSQDRNYLRIGMIDPLVFWPSREEESSFVVESGKRALLPTLKALGMRLGTNAKLESLPVGQTISWETIPSGMTLTQDVDEIWTDEFHYVNFGGELVKFENEFGFIPYAWHYGMQSSIPDPVLEATSTVFPFYAMDPYINTLLTAMLSWAIMSGMPTAVIETVAQAGVLPGTETAPTDIPLGQMITLQAGKKFSYAQPPNIGREVTECINTLLSFYDKAGVTSAARGMIGTRTPGLTFTSALEAAGDMVDPIKKGVEGQLEDICKMTWKAVEKFDVPLYITGDNIVAGKATKARARYVIQPSAIGHHYDLKCEMKPMSDQQRVQRGMHAAFMHDKGLWSTDRAMDFSGLENPEAERREILLDTIRQSPVYLQQAFQLSLAQAPEDVQQAAGEAAAQGIDITGMGQDMGPPVMGQEGGRAGAGQESAWNPSVKPAAKGGGGPPGGQVRGAAPRGGGRAAGMPRRPTGPRPVSQGTQTQR